MRSDTILARKSAAWQANRRVFFRDAQDCQFGAGKVNVNLPAYVLG